MTGPRSGAGATPLPTFPASAPQSLGDKQLRENLRRATHTIRDKRAGVVGEVPHWGALREAARALKEHTILNLDRYLEELERSVTRAGGHVHWARNAQEANRIIGDVVDSAGASDVVKVKSLTTDEIGLNEALEVRGIRATETDLAELIIQLAAETSSHFLVPAIHKNRTQIRDLFRQHFGLADLTDDPAALAEVARLHLREKFLTAEVAVSGANFAFADTGTVGVVESEGNGRMCLTLPRVLITLMGIEKVLPSFQNLGLFLQLLPRSATGERMNPYTSLWTGVHPGDGPEEFHLVLLDNGRTKVLADPVGRQALHCIRCSACLNICPVYERVGGHAYNATYPGPIGSILTPQLLGPGVHDSLPFASTLCGACQEVCPVDIEIPKVLLHLRGRAVDEGGRKTGVAGGPRRRGGGVGVGGWNEERMVMGLLAKAFRSPMAYRFGLAAARKILGGGRGDGWIRQLPGYGSGWTKGRDFPALADESFRDWWKRRNRDDSGGGSWGGRPK